MSSLAGTTEKLRSILKIGGIIFAGLFLLYLLIMGGVFMKNIFFPSEPEAPKQEFGELPEIIFTSPASPEVKYQINTISGELPTGLPKRMLVYKIKQPEPDLLALQGIRSSASVAGFNQNETKISDTLYQWTNPSTNANLQFDINTKNFEIRSNFLSNQNLISNPVFPEPGRIRTYVSNFLNALQVDLDGLVYKDNSQKYYSISGNSLIPVENAFNAKLLRVSLFHKNIENELGNFAFVYPNPEYPIVSLLVSYPSSSRMIVLEGEAYNHIITSESSDYYIKSVTQAFEDLQAGRGYLHNPNNLISIQITDAYLAYYLDKNTTQYAQPVYVFEGIDARGIVSAISYSDQSESSTSE